MPNYPLQLMRLAGGGLWLDEVQFNSHWFPHFYVVDEASRNQIEPYIAAGKVKVLRTLPVHIKGHQILECSF